MYCNIKKLSKNDLDLLVEDRNVLYDKILNLENYDLIKDKLNQINRINNLINFLVELNRFLFNLKLNITFDYVYIDYSTDIIFSAYNESGIKEKSYLVLPEYIETISQNLNLIDYRTQLQWIKELKISNYIDKLEKYYSNNYIQPDQNLNNTNTINLELIKNVNANIIIEEISHYKKLFINYFLSGYNFYLKGGFVIGFKLCQMIYFNYQEQNKITSEFNKKLILDTLDFIRDFDFTLCIGSGSGSDSDYPTQLEDFLTNDITEQYFRKEGQVVIVIRDKNNFKLPNGESFLELSVKNCSDPYEPSHMIDLEIPLTAMIIHVDKINIDMIFDIILTYWKLTVYGINDLNKISMDIDFDNLLKQITQLDIQIHPSTNLGLFDVIACDYGSGSTKLDNKMIDIIEKTAREFDYLDCQVTNKINKSNKSIEQFLASCQTQPDRLFIRLLNKNIPKSNKCAKLLDNYNIDISNVSWLLNGNIIMEIIKRFLTNLSEEYIDWANITNITNSNVNTNSLLTVINNYFKSKKIADLTDTLFKGSNLGRLIGEIDKITKNASLERKIQIYELGKILFGKNITHGQIIGFAPRDTSNIVRVQKSFCDLANSIIVDKIKLFL
jgi:hypothetical protein